jgi:hypothetical protein
MSTVATTQPVRRRFDIVSTLNGPQHYNALVFYLIVVAAHWLEHGVQAFQVYVLGIERTKALGLLGTEYPYLVKSEILHYGFALFMLVGLILLRPAMTGRARPWWNAALLIQVWHHVEHLLLLVQAQSGWHLAGKPKPTSIVQLLVPRIELHLLYNMLVLIPLLIAISLHWFRRGEDARTYRGLCSCYSHFR